MDGVDLHPDTVARAQAETARAGLDEAVRFHVGDAEGLPLPDGVYDAVVCECALCTFPDKQRAVAEVARLLRPGGRVGITDVTTGPGETTACSVAPPDRGQTRLSPRGPQHDHPARVASGAHASRSAATSAGDGTSLTAGLLTALDSSRASSERRECPPIGPVQARSGRTEPRPCIQRAPDIPHAGQRRR
ncbi:MAG: class I SAM-dependent methyltransferase [Pseudonocardiaceae bacterium]